MQGFMVETCDQVLVIFVFFVFCFLFSRAGHRTPYNGVIQMRHTGPVTSPSSTLSDGLRVKYGYGYGYKLPIGSRRPSLFAFDGVIQSDVTKL